MRDKETQKEKKNVVDRIICLSNNIDVLIELPVWVLYFFLYSFELLK